MENPLDAPDVAALVRSGTWPDVGSHEYLRFERDCLAQVGGPVNGRLAETAGGSGDDLVILFFRKALIERHARTTDVGAPFRVA